MAVKVVLDAAGGDYAPAEPVQGAVEAARMFGIQVVLVGPEAAIKAELAKHDSRGLALEVVDAPEVVRMEESAVEAVRHKRQSSLRVGLRLVKDGDAQAFVSAGNSGAVYAAALFDLGRIEGIDRPAISGLYPTRRGSCLLLDIGANTEVRAQHLCQFALLGSAYMEKALGRARPRVALLANGEEDSKGNQVVQEAHKLLRESPLNFVGNIEGRDIPTGEKADVVVCDGFVGNVVIKLSEGLSESLFGILRAELSASWLSKLAGAAMRPAFRRVRAMLDPEELGGAPLLGVKGVVILAHGRSHAKAVRNALRVANQAAEQRLVETITAGLAVPAQ
ncbi:MAG: phosphate acyltransferase PlsX [Chloroflexota bacterium]